MATLKQKTKPKPPVHPYDNQPHVRYSVRSEYYLVPGKQKHTRIWCVYDLQNLLTEPNDNPRVIPTRVIPNLVLGGNLTSKQVVARKLKEMGLNMEITRSIPPKILSYDEALRYLHLAKLPDQI